MMCLWALAGAVEPVARQATLTLEGHGRSPGATREHHFVAQVFDHDGGVVGYWAGESWSEAVAIRGDRMWTLEQGAWVPEKPNDRQLVKAFAVAPAVLWSLVEREPARLSKPAEQRMWALPDGLATLTFARGGLHTIEMPRSHPVFGDVIDRVEWTDSEIQVALTDDDVRWTATLRGPVHPNIPSLPPLPNLERFVTEEIAPATHVIEVPEAESRVLLHSSGTQGVIFDVPLSSALGQRVLDEAKRVAPDVTQWFVVVSHHHPHYTGGLRPWARDGATLVVHPALESWVREVLADPRSFDPADPPEREPSLLLVERRTTLLGGAVEVRAIDMRSGHTDAFILSFIVNQKILYVADIASHRVDAAHARHRGTWPEHLRPWKPERIVSAFPLDGADTVWDASLLHTDD